MAKIYNSVLTQLLYWKTDVWRDKKIVYNIYKIYLEESGVPRFHNLNYETSLTDIKCTKVHARDNPFSAIPKGFYLNQGVFINPKGKIPLPNSKVMIGATCLLSSTNYKSEQLYFGEATMKYTALRAASFNTSIGEQRVLMDSVFFHIDGLKTPIGPL